MIHKKVNFAQKYIYNNFNDKNKIKTFVRQEQNE